MKPFSRSITGLAGGILVLGAIATVGFLSALGNQHGGGAMGIAGGGIAMMAGGMGMGSGAPSGSMPKEIVIPWEKPAGPPPSWLASKETTNEREDALRSKLNDRMDIEENAAPLSAVMEFIADHLDIPVIIDDKALEEENITPDEPITFKRSDARVRDILVQVLEPLQLTYRIHLEAVVITSKKISANEMRFYDLSSFLPDNSLITDLLSGVQNMIAPDSWIDAGGTSAMRTVGSILVVSAPYETHLEIERFLQEVSKQPVGNMKPRAFVERSTPKPSDGEKPAEKPKAN
jgi:hypothetical protein